MLAAPEIETSRPSLLPPARAILDLVLRYSHRPEAVGDLHLAKILNFLKQNQPVHFVLPAFPAKSPNREKTLGSLPDYAELLGLRRLEELCREIEAIHAPGAHVTICSDGRVFSDLVLVSDAEVTAYQDGVRRMIADFGFARLSTFHLEEALGSLSFDEMRAHLTERHGRPVAELREEVRRRPEALAMFNGIHRFIFEDRLVLRPGHSRNRVREEAKEVAYGVVQRSNSWSRLVEEFFPAAVRLSIHPQFGPSEKIGFQLVPCANAWGTPWHNVALEDAAGIRLVKRKEAEQLGARLSLGPGGYLLFRAPELQ